MLTSLKSKISLTVAIFTIAILVTFSSLIFILSIRNKEVITPSELVEMPFLRPGLQRFLMENERINEIAEVAEGIREEQRKEYIKTVLFVTISLTCFAAVASYLVAIYLLRPIDHLTKDLKNLGPETMKKRLSGKYRADEVEFLAGNFNELLDRLQVAFDLQEQFIADAAHELRTPIASIKSNIDVAKKYPETMTLEQYEYLVNTIGSLNDKLVSLNEKLLFLNRKPEEDDYKTINLNELVEEINEELSVLALKNKIQIKLNLSKSPVNVKAHARNLSKALSNLVENSIKYRKKEGRAYVGIKTFIENDQVVIIIKDNGIGIAKKDQEKIFERFFRADNARDLTGQGEGLGLSITRKILDDHKAKIEIVSRLNKGTEFKITFPKGS